jgi:large exoprotein involved in heme utilization and adhesion
MHCNLETSDFLALLIKISLHRVAGDITLNATREIKVAGTASRVRNLVRLGSLGNGGNIIIDSGSFSLQDRAQLSASTFGQGNAGM